MNNLIKEFNSLNKINTLLFGLIILINLLYQITDIFLYKDIGYLIFNILELFLFIYVNVKFKKEGINELVSAKKLHNSKGTGKDFEIKELLFKKMFFKENRDSYSLFKNIYIKKNLQEKDYEDLRNIFLKFIPELFLREVGEIGSEKISLGISVKKELHVMFLDIIGFTRLAERLTAEKSLLLLNIYFDGIIEIIKGNGGYIDKFLGDGMMIIFDTEASDIVIRTAIEIQDFMNKLNIAEIGKKISVGIGINSGEVILGTIGSRKRMEITIIGDVVNTASRIEGLTREFNDKILISNATYEKINILQNFNIKDLGLKDLKGKKNKINIYGIN